jgi:hypothetical protein
MPEPIAESSVVIPIFVDGLSAMQTFGSVTHLVFTARQTSVFDGSTERVIQARLIIPADQMIVIGRQLLSGCIDDVELANNGGRKTALN